MQQRLVSFVGMKQSNHLTSRSGRSGQTVPYRQQYVDAILQKITVSLNPRSVYLPDSKNRYLHFRFIRSLEVQWMW